MTTAEGAPAVGHTHPRYSQRTVEWGHWGITFMDVQRDRSKNFGAITAFLPFPVGNAGPIDGHTGSAARQSYKQMCDRWMADGVLPELAQAAP